MKRVKSEDLVPGMVTAEDVYNYNSQLIFPKGFLLTERAISKLVFYAVPAIRVEDEIIAVPEVKADLHVETAQPLSHSQMVHESPEFKEFKKKFDQEISDFKDHINQVVRRNAPLDADTMLDSALQLAELGKHSFGVLDLLNNMHDNDDETYTHCLNVALICNVMSDWLNMSEEEIRMATLCGLFHDIGKLEVPDIILHKKGKLTKEERKIVQTHSLSGYNLIKGLDIDTHVKNSALMHHERCDGSGYPFGLTGEKIDPYAKLVAIADVYDAMTSVRAYRKALSPFTTISIMEDEGLQKYETSYIMTFLKNVVNTYINNRVLLSDGEEGEVIFIHREHLARPTVKCGETFLDLSVRKDIEILSII